MSKIEVTSVGPVTSVQDGGRRGVQRFGLAPGGAMDPLSLVAANCLVGVPLFGAAIEIGPFGTVLTARDGAVRVGLTGAVRDVEVSGTKIEFNRTVLIAENESLRLGNARKGVFSYLSIEGGIRGEPTFGSFAVHARAGLGSPFPRPLQAGDIFTTEDAGSLQAERRLDLPVMGNEPIRVVLGPQDDEFGPSAIATLLESEWTISAASDRMGYRIEGPSLKHDGGHNIVSDGTVTGSIQVPSSGQPIVLLPDRGTTGGYPKIATVISVDVGRFAQTGVGQHVKFRAVSIEEAQTEARRMHEFLQSLPDRILDVRDGAALNISALQNANLAGAAVNAVDSVTWHLQAEPGP
jgi:biotin-dependent carboxylase-like uncharacterized protein